MRGGFEVRIAFVSTFSVAGKFAVVVFCRLGMKWYKA